MMRRPIRFLPPIALAVFCGAALFLSPLNVAPLRAQENTPQTLTVLPDGTIVSHPQPAVVQLEPAAPPTVAELPEFDQAAVALQQRQRADGIGKAMRLRLQTAESRHFLIFSDLDIRVCNGILVWLEDFHTKLLRSFRLTEADRLWDGKCLVLVFSKQEDLARYALAYDRHVLGRSRGYFVLEARMSDAPRLVHIATYQDVDDGNRGLREVLVHEATHAVLELYGQAGELPLWLHEGLAEYMVVTVDPTQRAIRQERAYARAAATPYVTIADLFNNKKFLPSDIEDYAVSFSIVDFLQRRDAAALRTLIDLLKAGTPPAEALQKACGLTFEELEQQWRGYVLRFYRPADPRS